MILKYDGEGNPLIENIRRVSKPSRRVYLKKKDIYKVLNGFGVLIVSNKRVVDRKSSSIYELLCSYWGGVLIMSKLADVQCLSQTLTQLWRVQP